VGDQVLLKLQPYAQESVVNRPYPKIAYKYFGPFKVLEKIGQVAYKLELPESSKIHNVFHVSQVKEYRADHTPVFKDLPNLPTLGTMDIKPEKILERRMVKKGNAAISQVLVKWCKLPEDTATWEKCSSGDCCNISVYDSQGCLVNPVCIIHIHLTCHGTNTKRPEELKKEMGKEPALTCRLVHRNHGFTTRCSLPHTLLSKEEESLYPVNLPYLC
jgi:hypothetical protein